ncbi:hypothetical protein OUZ56_001497 [Daphnia magna]|uniref:Uncharacterized protein n=1 Tax=Daphnia magna TaxID=35525 RepID=A0ABR0A2W5_9CRUS|nr:hypothetical protein OUZ56_001497 [Daphnia magna]
MPQAPSSMEDGNQPRPPAYWASPSRSGLRQGPVPDPREPIAAISNDVEPVQPIPISLLFNPCYGVVKKQLATLR